MTKNSLQNSCLNSYDAHGEKFYYNQRTQESTFDDPRFDLRVVF